MNIQENAFSGVKRIVLKIGTRIIIDEDGQVNNKRVNSILNDVSRLIKEGYEVVLVSSGAVGMGMSIMGFDKRPRILAEKQACAAIGQVGLMNLYTSKLKNKNLNAAQVLLSAEDFLHTGRYNNIRRTVQALIKQGALPVINENDTISTEELKVGDNDKLSSDVAHFLEADLLVILSDQKGLFTKNPLKYKDAELLKVVPSITPEILKMGAGTSAQVSVGGMRVKLKAIKQAADGGTPVVLTNGNIYSLVHGKLQGTFFLPNPNKLKRRQRWLAFMSKSSGRIFLDKGASRVIRSGKSSLLAAGITGAEGNFKVGNFVEICSHDKKVIGRGKTEYSLSDVKKIKGQKSGRFTEILGRAGKEEVVHRDNLVIYSA